MGIFGLLRGHSRLTALIDQTIQIAEPNILTLEAQFQQHIEAGNPRRTAARRHDLDIGKGFPRKTQRIGCGRAHDNRRSMLVVMENGNIHSLTA